MSYLVTHVSKNLTVASRKTKNGRLQEGFPEDRGGSELPPGHGQENPNAAAGCEDP